MSRVEKAGRNDRCPCGSGKKHKKCCEPKAHSGRGGTIMAGVVLAVIVGALAVAFTSFTDEGTATAAPGKVWSPEHGHYH